MWLFRKTERLTGKMRVAQPPGAALDAVVWAFLDWVEDENARNGRDSPSTLPIYPTMPRRPLESDLVMMPRLRLPPGWSFLRPSDKPKRRKVADAPVAFPFLRTDRSGAVVALWVMGEMRHYVLIGAEGQAYCLAKTPLDLLALLALGYESITDRALLEFRPGLMADHPGVAAARNWLRVRFNMRFPATGAELLPFLEDDDPFTRFAMAQSIAGFDRAKAAKTSRLLGRKRR